MSSLRKDELVRVADFRLPNTFGENIRKKWYLPAKKEQGHNGLVTIMFIIILPFDNIYYP